MPLGSFRESSSLATVPTLAYRPPTRGTSKTSRSPSRAAAMAACASSRSIGIVTTMFGSTTPLVSGSRGMKSVFGSDICCFSFVFSPVTTGETLGLCPQGGLDQTGLPARVSFRSAWPSWYTGLEERADDLVDGGGDQLRRPSPIDEPELALITVIADQ